MTHSEDNENNCTDLVVDLSNVLMDDLLAESEDTLRWSSWVRLRDVLVERFGVGVRFHLVLDRSIWHDLRVEEQRELEGDDNSQIVNFADPLVLQMADRLNGLVVSRDRFDDFRDEFSWLENEARLVTWTPQRTPDGRRLRVSVDTAPERPRHRISAAVERRELGDRGFRSREAVGLLEHEWRCANDSCLSRTGFAPAIPRYDIRSDRVLCPVLGCGSEMEAVGTRRPAIELKISIADEDSTVRLALEEGEELLLGRGPAQEQAMKLDLESLFDSQDLGAISRTHARLSVHDGALWITDLGSSNGTCLQRPSRSASALQPQQEAKIPLGFEARLARHLRVGRSGKRYAVVSDGVRNQVLAETGDGGDVGPTRGPSQPQRPASELET